MLALGLDVGTTGVKGILITVADGKAENPAIAKARKAGQLGPLVCPPSCARKARRPAAASRLYWSMRGKQVDPLVAQFGRYLCPVNATFLTMSF